MTAPAVSTEALRALQALRMVSQSAADDVLQAQHRPCLRQEVLMRQSMIPATLATHALRPLPSRPPDVASGIQAKTIRLLARLLREQIDHRVVAAGSEREARDE